MLVKGSDIIGKKVITVQEGKKVENVDDIIYDPRRNKVLAFLVDGGGWFSDAKVLTIEDVKNIGEDAVIIESEQVIKKASDLGERASNIAREDIHLTKTKVVTEEGNEIGRVTDILFDSKTGKVEELEVSEGGLKTLQSGKKKVKVEDIITIGEDMTIVKKYTKDKFGTQAYDKRKGQIDNVRNNLQYYLDDAKIQFNKLSSQLQKKAEEILENPSNKAQVKKTKEELERYFQEVREKFGSKAFEIKNKAQQQLRQDATGKYLTKTIMDHDDKVIAKRGEMVTNKILNQAEKAAVLDQVLRNLSNNPI